MAAEILEAVRKGMETPEDALPPKEAPRPTRKTSEALVDLLKVLLKSRAEDLGVAPKLLASSDELTAIAGEDEPQVPALSGWRRAAFGELALQLKRGEIALSAHGGGVEIVEFDD